MPTNPQYEKQATSLTINILSPGFNRPSFSASPPVASRVIKILYKLN